MADGHHNYLYCVLYQPEISGGAYDALMRELLQLQEQFPDLRTTLLLAEAIRNGAPFIRYLASEAMITIGTNAFIEGFASLSAADCDRVVQVVREWEKRRVPFSRRWRARGGSLSPCTTPCIRVETA